MDNAQALRDRGRTLESRGQDQAALDLYSRVAEEVGQTDPSLLVRIGNLQLRLGQKAEAVASFARCAARLEEAGLSNSALALLHRVSRIDPSFSPAALKMAELKARQGYHQEAHSALQRFCDLMEGAGEADAALDALRSFVAAHPRHADARRMLIQRLENRGLEEEARTMAASEPPSGDRASRPGSPTGPPPEREAHGMEGPEGGDGADLGLQVLGSSWEGADLEGGPVADASDLDLLPTLLDAQPSGYGDVAPLADLEPTRLEGLEVAAPDDADGPEDAGMALPLLGRDPEPDSSPSPAPEASPAAIDRAQRLRDLIQQRPGDVEARLELIDLLQERGESEEQIPLLEEAQAALADVGRFAEAADLVTRSLRHRPDSLELLARRVEYALDAGDDRRSVAALLALGRRLDARADAQGARQTFARVLRIEPENAEAAAALAALDAPAAPGAAGRPVRD